MKIQISSNVIRFLSPDVTAATREQVIDRAKGLQMVAVNPELGENLEEYTKLMRDIFGH